MSTYNNGADTAPMDADAPISATGCKQPVFDVDPSGQAIYRIPVEVPPGIAGLEPNLELCYSHRQSDQILGVGWSLSGLSAITRIKANYATDGFNGGINYDANDRYALDGQRLINIEGDYGAGDTVYYTEMQSWRYIQAGSTDEEGFTVTMKNGEVWKYGTTPDSRILASGGTAVRVWALSVIEDLNGNSVLYQYTQVPVNGGKESGAYYIEKISYTQRDDMEANRFVQFNYEQRPDPINLYIGGYPVFTSYRMASIVTMLADGKAIRTYTLNYRISDATQLSCIDTITESGAEDAGSPALPATQLVWQDCSTPGFDIGTSSVLDQHLNPVGLYSMDVNGDGCTDLVQLWQDNDNTLHATVYLATQDGGNTSYVRSSDYNMGSYPATRQFLPMDVNGDGRCDLVLAYQESQSKNLKLAVFLSDGTSFTDGGTFDTGDTWDSKHIGFYAADVNGDGRSDLVSMYGHYDPQMGDLLYFSSYLSLFGDGDGQMFTDGIVSPTQDAAQPTQVLAIWPMDVNGDGMTDMVRIWKRGSDAHIIATAYLSVSQDINNVSFANQVSSDLGTFSMNNQLGFLPADVNGDGMTDLLQIWQEPLPTGTNLHLSTFLCDGAGSFVAGPDSVFENQTINKNKFYPMGFTGGSQTNLLNQWVTGSGELMFKVYSSSPSGTFRLATDFKAGMAGTTIANASFFAGDANGDGKADLIRVSASQDKEPLIVPYTSAGLYPDLISSITNPLGGIATIAYAPLTDPDVYSADAAPVYPAATGRQYPNALSPAQFPVQSVIGQALYVVSGYVLSNDSSLSRFAYSNAYSFNYADAKVDLTGRGWQGFGSISKLNQNSGLCAVKSYNQDYPQTGTIASESIIANGNYSTDPRVAGGQMVLMSVSNYTYTTYTRATGATNHNQQVQEVLKTAAQTLQYNYGESNFDYAIGQNYSYDDYGNQTKYTYLGYIDKDSGAPLYSNEVVYRYYTYQNDIFDHGWALGYQLYMKTSANATDSDITCFLPGDFNLQQQTYAAGTYNQLTSARWDDTNNCYLTLANTYDDYGNKKTESAPGGALTVYTYETAYNTYTETITSPENSQGLALSTNHGYDPRYGTEVAREDANSFIFITALDAFGRKSADQGPLPDITGIQGDTNLLTVYVTGSVPLKSSFQSAAVVTLATTAYTNDGYGGNYTEVNTLQAFPAASAASFLYERSFVDGLGQERQKIKQSGQSAGDVMLLADYNSTGKIVTQTLPFFSTNAVNPASSIATGYTYDVLDRKLSQSQPAGPDGATDMLTTWSYDGGGLITQSEAAGTDAAYVQTYLHHFYDTQDRVTQTVVVTDNNASTTVTYDAIARTLSMTDPVTAANPEGVPNVIRYDSLDRKTSFDNADQNTTGDSNIKAMFYVYDAGTGLLSRQTDAAQQVTSYTYDQLGRVVQTGFTDGRSIRYVYDGPGTNGNGLLTQVTVLAADQSQESKQDYTYDCYGNNNQVTLAIEGETDTYTTGMLFDPQKRLVTETLPDNSTVERTYNYGLLTHLASGSNSTDYPLEQYTATGKSGSSTYANGITNTYQYSPSGLLYGETVANNSGNILQQSYAYDALNQIRSITDELDNAGTQAFTYLNKRLATANIPGFDPGSYGYDTSGNITTKDGGSYTYNAHFPATITKDGNTLYAATQDACGRTLTRNSGGRELSFTYNSQGNLVQVSSGGAPLSTVLSDYTGRRIKEEKADGTIVLYISSAYQVKRKGTDTAYSKYLIDVQGAVAVISSGSSRESTLYFRRNHKGSITLTFGADASVVTQIAYDGYGLSSIVSGPDNHLPEYEQKTWDADTGLYYFGARYYDPVTGRFLTPDSSLGSSIYLRADNLNRFAFELNNPINITDPDGHMAAWVGGLLIGVAILVVGVALIASGGTLAPVIAAGVGVSATAVSAIITVAGSAAIAAGISATAYSANHRQDFSWKDFAIQTAISGAVGAVTGGLFLGLSAGVATISSSFWAGAANIVGAGLISAGGDVTGQFFTNLAEGAPLSENLWQSAVIGFSFGAAGAVVGSIAEKGISKFTQWRFSGAGNPQEIEMQVFNSRDAGGKLTSYGTFSAPSVDVAPDLLAQQVKANLESPVGRLIMATASASTALPEAYLENKY